MTKTLIALSLVLLFQNAWAIDIDDAKARGLVGEANTGYLAPVKQPASAEVRALVQEVNTKRKDEFERTAKRTGANLQQVAFRFYELAVQRTAPGNYYQDQGGRWVKK